MKILQRISLVTVVASALLAAPAFAQERLSLLERMNVLESKVASMGRASSPTPAQPNVEVLNKLAVLQGEIQSLRSQLEQIQNENAQIKQRSLDQYTDIDTRLAKLEGGGAGSGAAPAVAAAPASVFSDVAPVVDNAAKEAADYEEAYKALIDRGEAAEAARLFQVFLKQYPDGELTANAWYWLGESYYVTQNYQLALESFQMVLSKFPESRKAPDAMLKAGYSQMELKQFGEGLATLNKLITEHAGHPAAEMAISRLRGLSLDQQR